MKKTFSSREMAVLAALAALSITTQIIHIGYQSPFGMWIDVVGIFWVMAFFLYGARGAALTTLVGWLVLSFTQPDSWWGAGMKILATGSMWVALWGVLIATRKDRTVFANPMQLLLPLVLGSILRCVLMIPLNYYLAIPLWVPGTTPTEAMQMIPWYIIVLFNILQGVVDVGIAWLLVYKFKMKRFGDMQ